MDFPKQTKDIIYKLLQEPTLDKFREFLCSLTGEHNSIDFKGEWIKKSSLAKEMLALANSKGGIIVFGIAENEDKSTNIKGLPKLKDKSVVSDEIKNLISSNLKYVIYDYSFTTSEYEDLIGKHFQLLVVEDTPEYIPFLAKKDSEGLKQNTIYVRRGTSCEIADESELQNIFKRRLNYTHPENGEPLKLDEHLSQLKILYDKIAKDKVYYKSGFTSELIGTIKSIVDAVTTGEKVVEPNPLYPDESYEEFISRMIVEKKKKIERVLDLY